MCLLSKTFTTFAKSKKWRKKKLALTSNQKYLISPLISVGQHENISYAQDLCGRRVREHLWIQGHDQVQFYTNNLRTTEQRVLHTPMIEHPQEL
jgi:hypothetical protein